MGLALFTLLYNFDYAFYMTALKAIILTPFPHPFIDWQWFPSAVACWQKGVDVYADNTCYLVVPHSHFNYSPLWLRASFLAALQPHLGISGLVIGAIFFFALSWLPQPHGRRDLVITLLASCSSLTVFAIERANPDLIIFVMVVIGVKLWAMGLGRRIAAYALFLFAGLLKFYPLVLLAMAARESCKVLIAITAAATALVGLLLALYRHEMALALQFRATGGGIFSDTISYQNLPAGIVQLLHESSWGANIAASLGIAAVPLVLAILLTGAAGVAFWLTAHTGLAAALRSMAAPDRGFLQGGAVLICGCFFAGQNIGYRGVFLLLVMPGLLQLARLAPPGRLRQVIRGVCYAVVFVMWVLSLQLTVMMTSALLAGGYRGQSGPLWIAHWIVHEIAWWGIISVLLAIVAEFLYSAWRVNWRRLPPLGM